MTTEEKRDCVRLALAEYGRGYSYQWEVYDRPGGTQLESGWKGSELATYTAKGNYNVVYVRPAAKPDAPPERVSFWTRRLSEEEAAVSHTVRTLRAEGEDPEQDQTYLFERSLYQWGQDPQKVEEISTEVYGSIFVEEACNWAGIPMPDVIRISDRLQKAGQFQTSAEGLTQIVVAPYQEVSTWLHESAHYILYKQELDHHHTAQFRKLCVDLYTRFDDSFVGNPFGAQHTAELCGVDIDWAYQASNIKGPHNTKKHITSYNGSYAL